MSVQKHISAFYTIYLEKYGLIGVKLKLLCSLLVQRFNSWTPNSWLKLTKYCQMTAWLYSHTFKIWFESCIFTRFYKLFYQKIKAQKKQGNFRVGKENHGYHGKIKNLRDNHGKSGCPDFPGHPALQHDRTAILQ